MKSRFSYYEREKETEKYVKYMGELFTERYRQLYEKFLSRLYVF